MEVVCPLCNGLESLSMTCPRCGLDLVDKGPVQDYLGPYSPYREKGEVLAGDGGDVCLHLAACPDCPWETWVTVPLFPF